MEFETCEISGAVPETPAAGLPQTDPKPEYVQYKDEGCTYARACLSCPYERCLYEARCGKRSAMTGYRAREIRNRFKSGCTVKDLARMFGVTARTVYRAIEAPHKKKQKGAKK
jgi:hypothetical protein